MVSAFAQPPTRITSPTQTYCIEYGNIRWDTARGGGGHGESDKVIGQLKEREEMAVDLLI